jgi:2-enoate reductase
MKMFERSQIGTMSLRNRLAMAPMGTNGLTDIDCGYGRRLIEFYEARARGGLGMVMTGAAVTNTEIEGGIAHLLPRIDSPAYMGRLSELADAVHNHDCKLVLQLTAGFGRVNFVADNPIPPVSASENVCFLDPTVTTRALTKDEIQQLVVSYATSAGMAKVAGVDAISIQGYGGYIIDQFMSALWNRRDDEYGGDLDGRMRFAMEILGATRAAVGDMPIIFKFTPDHCIEGGRTLEEGLEIARRLEAAGVDALHVDAGCYESWNRVIPSMYEKPGSQLELVKAIKEIVTVPVIGHGKLGNPKLAQRVIDEGIADYVCLGRPVLADPEWPNKVRAGLESQIKPCIACNDACIGRGYEMKYLGCTVNPLTGMERTYEVFPATSKKKVLVVGGGPGGMEAARVAAERGLDVTLWEQAAELGGKLLPAAAPSFKQDIVPLIAYLKHGLERAGVKVELGRVATPDAIEAFGADRVILATGSRFSPPPIPGVDLDNVYSSAQFLSDNPDTGGHVIVIGAGLCGSEVAAELAVAHGKKVTLVEMAGEVVPEGTNIPTLMGIRSLLAQGQVDIRVDTKVMEITRNGIIAERNGKSEAIAGDAVVMATGYVPDATLRDAVESRVADCVAIGDSVKVGKILDAIWSGFHAARVIE